MFRLEGTRVLVGRLGVGEVQQEQEGVALAGARVLLEGEAEGLGERLPHTENDSVHRLRPTCIAFQTADLSEGT